MALWKFKRILFGEYALKYGRHFGIRAIQIHIIGYRKKE